MRVKTVTIAVLAALCLFQAVVAQDDAAGADDAGDGEDSTTPAAPTEPPQFSVNFHRTSVDTNAIGIRWENDDDFDSAVSYYYVTAQREGSDSVLRSANISNTDRTFNVEDLVHESGYTICLYAVMTNGTLARNCENDETLETIPFVRDDSLIVLFCVLGCILLMILLGYFCWSYAKKKAEEEYEEEEEEEEEKEGGAALLA